MIAFLAPAVAAIVSVPLATSGPASAIAVFLLACVIAAVAGGLWSGLLAAVISSFTLPFLFGTERFSLQLDGAEDVVAAIVFLAVALVVGLLVGGATEDRARAARREREARLLGYLSSKLLTGEMPGPRARRLREHPAGSVRAGIVRHPGGARRATPARAG